MKPGDLVKLTCFPPMELGWGATPNFGVLVRLNPLRGAWEVLLEGQVCLVHEAGLKVVSERPICNFEEPCQGKKDISLNGC